MPEEKSFDSDMLYFLVPAIMMVVVMAAGVLLYRYFPSIPNQSASAQTTISQE